MKKYLDYLKILFRVTSYVDQMSAWYDVKTKQEVINIKVFEKLEVLWCLNVRYYDNHWLCRKCKLILPFIQKSVGTWGLTGLDRLLCFMIVQELQNFLVGLQRLVLRDKTWMDLLAGLNRTLAPIEGIICKWKIWTWRFHIFVRFVMAHLHYRRRTWIRIPTQFPILKKAGSRDPNLSLCYVNMLCTVQCSHRVWNLNPGHYPSTSPAI